MMEIIQKSFSEKSFLLAETTSICSPDPLNESWCMKETSSISLTIFLTPERWQRPQFSIMLGHLHNDWLVV
jgi:hypothetical protein